MIGTAPNQPGAPNQPPGSEEATLGKAYDLALVRRLWPFVRPHWKLLLAWAIFMPLTIAFELAQPALFRYALTEHILTGKIDALPLDAIAYMALVVAQGGSAFCETWFLQLAGQRTMHAMRSAIFDHVLAQRAAFFDRIPVGRLMTRMTNDIESLNEMFAQGAITLIADLVKMVGIIVIMLLIDTTLALLTFATLPFLIVLVEYARRLMRASFRQIRVRLAAMNAFAQEHLSGIKVVQLLGRGPTAQREYNEINAGHRDAYLGQIRADASMYAIVEAIGTVAVALVIWYASGHRAENIAMIGVVVVFIEYINKFFIPVRDLSQKYAVMQGAMAASERIFQLLDTKDWDGVESGPARVATAADGPEPFGGGDHSDRPAVELAGVHFSYGAEPVLRGVDVRVPRGATVAVVGATGSGKSTVIKLLTRLYERDQGAIRLDGVDIRELPLPELRRRITVVSQDVILFAGTLADNIALGKTYTPAQLEAAIRRVGLDRALARRGGGGAGAAGSIDAPVAERGSNFSAGERQLVAFARALLRDPEILILDEATAHVDPEAEELIERGVAELMKGRTTLVIAHRLSTIRNADLIVVMDKGQVVEQGTHAELVARGGFYAALERTFRRQDP
ncbi:MAG: ABC transporter ATP-binding protein [Deltaproteobacteria bacterium]|nr:ABC transporter ATP-binding protein [Deltaproteobacteria bacterium]MDQ3299356.1 ABC transporter ATP-binding protein/permease [Myxococcota bacterium]